MRWAEPIAPPPMTLRLLGRLVGVVALGAAPDTARAAALAGDFNRDGRVDAADYTVWRDTQNATGLGLAADGNNDRVVNTIDYDVWTGARPGVTNFRTNADGINATGTNFGSDALTDGSRLFPSVYSVGPIGGFDSFFLSATPVVLPETTTFFQLEAVFAQVGDNTAYAALGNVQLFVWELDEVVNGEPLAANTIVTSTPLNYGNVQYSDKPPEFGGKSSTNAAAVDFRSLTYRLLSGAFDPVTLPPGEYAVAILSDRITTFEMASSAIPKTGAILPGDRYYDRALWSDYEPTTLYELTPEFGGTLALDLYFDDHRGGYGATLAGAATVPEPGAVTAVVAALATAIGRRASCVRRREGRLTPRRRSRRSRLAGRCGTCSARPGTPST
ncbi:MAG: hypothetical protein AAF743_12940 [Planctomycetota bacterium]